jgi:hypothetical protein
MGKGSGKPLDKIKAHFPHLDEEKKQAIANIVEQTVKTGSIPEAVAINPVTEESACFMLDFSFLNENECNYTQINQAQAARIVQVFKQITIINHNELAQTSIIRDTVNRSPEYVSLFNRLPDDVTSLQEIPISHAGRIFCFYDPSRFYIVSVETNHR